MLSVAFCGAHAVTHARDALLAAVALACALAMHSQPSWAAEPAAEDQAAELAKKLSNPVADLISVPFKLDQDFGIGPANASRNLYVVQPVIPVSISEGWNVISRTILPYVDIGAPVLGDSNASGLADTLQSFFFSPKAPTSGGWIWGAGPAISLPTGTRLFGSGQWSLGPTAVLLKQEDGWTYGVLANQLWSVGENSHRAAVSSAFVQPFLTYTTKTHTTFILNSETTMDWKTSQATVPINAAVSQLARVAGLPVSFLLGGRLYANRPHEGPNWGLRFQVTLLFPK
jgi:hypothetical protein